MVYHGMTLIDISVHDAFGIKEPLRVGAVTQHSLSRVVPASLGHKVRFPLLWSPSGPMILSLLAAHICNCKRKM